MRFVLADSSDNAVAPVDTIGIHTLWQAKTDSQLALASAWRVPSHVGQPNRTGLFVEHRRPSGLAQSVGARTNVDVAAGVRQPLARHCVHRRRLTFLRPDGLNILRARQL
jgi:hypothetical protein